MMSTLILIAMVLVLVHFVYDKIILPTIGLHLRYRLFELRDQLRKIIIEEGRTERDKAFIYLQDGISVLLNRLPEITLSLNRQISKELQTNEELKRQIEERINLINQSGNTRLLELYKETNRVIEKAFLANMGIWFIYLFPIALIIVSMKKISQISTELIAMPASVTMSLMPVKTHQLV